MHAIGCDLHSRRSQFCLVDGGADTSGYPLPSEAILLEREIPTDPEAIERFLADADQIAPGPKALAVETTGNWFWFLDFVEPLVEEVHLVHAARAKAILSARVKTDRLDSRGLAWLVKNRLVPDVYIPPKTARALRELFRHRMYVSRTRTRLKNRIHSVLLKLGIQRVHSDLFGPGGRAFLSELELDFGSALILQQSLDLVDMLQRQIDDLDEKIADHPLRPSAAIRLLDTLPGVGAQLATHAALEIVDIQRFASERHFVSYCGLAPGTHQSQDTHRRQGLMPHGNRWLKWIFILAARQAARHAYFSSGHRRLCARKGKMVARISVARRMAICAYHMLDKNEAFRGA